MVRATIIDKIKARMDELSPFSSTELNTSISLIDEMLDDSATAFLLAIPVYLITPTSFLVDAQASNTVYQNGEGRIELPDDFLRLHTFKMDEWDREVNSVVRIGDPRYNLQFNTVTRGGHSKPVVIIKGDPAPGGIRYLHYFSLNDPQADTIETALYIYTMSAVSIEDSLIPAFVWFVASEVFIAMANTEASNAAKQKFADITFTKTL